MCGIFSAIKPTLSQEDLKLHFSTISHRGPDHSAYKVVNEDLHLGFHRLAICGLDDISNQPMNIDRCWLVANAEVFNHKDLIAKYDLKTQTNSDCEVIILLYRKFGIDKMIKMLDAEFAFVLYDEVSGEIFAARDHLGVRGLYIGTSGNSTYLASEAKALTFCDKLQHFPMGSYLSFHAPQQYIKHYDFEYARHDIQDEQKITAEIKRLVTDAVKKRLMSDRPVGCLLSGGLDSSIVSALAAKYYQRDEPIETFSIGLKGSPDLLNARLVADHIGSKHHEVELTEAEFLAAIDDTIYTCGSFDVTTIRASVGHKLISQYVRDHSDVKVLFTGETIDEMGSYLYFQNAPSPDDFQEECLRLLSEIHYFDMLRGDRSISSAGLEARVPFSDKAFVEFFMGIDPRLRMFDDDRIEKYLVRKAFEADDLLPKEVLWRRKNGFSDSVSSQTRSWSQILGEHIDTLVTDEEFISQKDNYKHDTPSIKEGYYYRKKYHESYGHHELTPFQWLPRWCGDIKDPSARTLNIYAGD